MNNTLIIRNLGLQPYQPIWQSMQDLTLSRDENTLDEIWVVQHEPVFTQGQAGNAEHLINTGDIPVVPVDRGGQVTYHGPGQIILYLMIDLRRMKSGVRNMVAIMENAIISTLESYGIEAHAKKEAPGVYVDNAKIASLGLRVKRGRSYHGLALNFAMDMEPFSRINPCGYAGMRMTQVTELKPEVDIDELIYTLTGYFVNEMGYTSTLKNNTLEPQPL